MWQQKGQIVQSKGQTKQGRGGNRRKKQTGRQNDMTDKGTDRGTVKIPKLQRRLFTFLLLRSFTPSSKNTIIPLSLCYDGLFSFFSFFFFFSFHFFRLRTRESEKTEDFYFVFLFLFLCRTNAIQTLIRSEAIVVITIRVATSCRRRSWTWKSNEK